jgi:hypothetical protein
MIITKIAPAYNRKELAGEESIKLSTKRPLNDSSDSGSNVLRWIALAIIWSSGAFDGKRHLRW